MHMKWGTICLFVLSNKMRFFRTVAADWRNKYRVGTARTHLDMALCTIALNLLFGYFLILFSFHYRVFINVQGMMGGWVDGFSHAHTVNSEHGREGRESTVWREFPWLPLVAFKTLTSYLIILRSVFDFSFWGFPQKGQKKSKDLINVRDLSLLEARAQFMLFRSHCWEVREIYYYWLCMDR